MNSFNKILIQKSIKVNSKLCVGLDIDSSRLPDNFDKTIKRSRSVSKRLSKGIEYLLKKNKIKHISGSGVLKSPNSIEVITNDGNSEIYESQNIIIATGARNKVFPGLETDGKLVISDRYIDSRYAYQSASLDGILKDPLSYIEQIHQPWTILPNLTLYFDLSPELGAKRSGSTNKFEQVSFLKKVHDSYEQVISKHPDRFVRIDATLPPADMAQLAIKSISNSL